MATPIFDSVHHALSVSYAMAMLPATPRSATSLAINKLMREAGLVTDEERESRLNFGGLTPLEVRAQCAMITAAVRDHLPEPERRAIEAWFAHDHSKPLAMEFLCTWCEPHWTVVGQKARLMMTWRANVTDRSRAAALCSLRVIESDFGIPKSTVHHQVVKIRKVCRTLRERGIGALDEPFRAQGLIQVE